ncbi:hypothetical protein BYT27DRAFT_7320414 [Phlegmacium glaucopus]|nr:hypothetical protein BYT27DRAFT_7320414 [Phlegmacium glaucopus]
MNRYNAHHNYIPLYCSQPSQTLPQGDSEVELSDFPPIKERNSTPPMSPVPVHSRPLRPKAAPGGSQQLPVSSEEEPPRSQHRRQPGLGQANILNMVDAVAPVPHAKGVRSHPGKSLLKHQDSGIQDAADEHPLKKQRLALRDENNMKWVRQEIAGVKESLEKIAAEAREDRRDINSIIARASLRNPTKAVNLYIPNLTKAMSLYIYTRYLNVEFLSSLCLHPIHTLLTTESQPASACMRSSSSFTCI